MPVQTARTPYARTGPFSVMFTPFPSCDLHTRRASTRRPLSTASVAPLLLLWPALPFSLFVACAFSTPSHHLRVPHSTIMAALGSPNTVSVPSQCPPLHVRCGRRVTATTMRAHRAASGFGFKLQQPLEIRPGTRPTFQKSRRDWISSQRDWISSQRDWN